jgi:hypothetical protein
VLTARTKQIRERGREFCPPAIFQRIREWSATPPEPTPWNKYDKRHVIAAALQALAVLLWVFNWSRNLQGDESRCARKLPTCFATAIMDYSMLSRVTPRRCTTDDL